MEKWLVLVVDDEEDVHAVTQLAFKRKLWRNRPFELLHAHSAEAARKLLETPEQAAEIQVALVDVVMETPDAGLMLSRHIRRTCPTSLRIILRTGQPGEAPPAVVLTEYDIDCYLSKGDLTAEALFSSVCASLRSSQDISTLLALGRQIQNFTKALRRVSTIDDLLVFMHEGLRFLESKYGTRLAFHYDLAQANRLLQDLDDAPEDEKKDSVATASITTATAASKSRPPVAVPYAQVTRQLLAALSSSNGQVKDLQLYPGTEFGLTADTFVVPFTVQEERSVYGALFATISVDSQSAKLLSDFHSDVTMFLENWSIAYGSLLLQERAARERMLREEMHRTRLQAIAQMVAGIAHEVNTPLGVANTANSMLTSLVERITAAPAGSPELPELVSDLASTSTLLTKNLLRAHSLIRSFKQLSVGQLSDRRVLIDLRAVLSDCLETMGPEIRKGKLQVVLNAEEELKFPWNGYPGHLSQVIVNLIQNAMRYAYPNGSGGKLEIRISLLAEGANGIRDGFRVEVQDFGVGIPPKIRSRLFEPFATSALGSGGTGLGLAISRNIVTDLLKGSIEVSSESDKGTTFVVDLPRVVVDAGGAHGQQ